MRIKLKLLGILLALTTLLLNTNYTIIVNAEESKDNETQITGSEMNEEETGKQEEVEDVASMTAMDVTLENGKTIGYWLYRPTRSTEEKLPLIIYLHGISERGNNLDKLLNVSLPKYLYDGSESTNAVVIAPQCPTGTTWAKMTDQLMELIQKVVEEQNIDQSMISMTGHSLGGIGTLEMAIKYPDYFAAIAPVSANIDVADCSVITSTKVWAFHGSADYAMGFSIVKAKDVVNAAGGDMDLTMFGGKGHAITDIVYHNSEINLLSWLAKQQREDILSDGTPVSAEVLASRKNIEAVDTIDENAN